MAIPDAVRVVIVEEYRKYGVPADDIATDTKHAREFAARVNQRLPYSLRMTVDLCTQTTIKLRKRGEANGGLPKLSNGHGPHKGGPKNGYGPKPVTLQQAS